jgi:hypothetical protein
MSQPQRMAMAALLLVACGSGGGSLGSGTSALPGTFGASACYTCVVENCPASPACESSPDCKLYAECVARCPSSESGGPVSQCVSLCVMPVSEAGRAALAKMEQCSDVLADSGAACQADCSGSSSTCQGSDCYCDDTGCYCNGQRCSDDSATSGNRSGGGVNLGPVVGVDECSDDLDCLADELCDGGSCVESSPSDECSVDEDCAEDWFCEDGTCV